MRFLVRKLDDVIRKSIGAFEFNYDENCLLRLQVNRAAHTLHLPNLTIEPGDQVLLIHQWNEHLPPFSAGGAYMAWARRFLRLIDYSFRLIVVKRYLKIVHKSQHTFLMGQETIEQVLGRALLHPPTFLRNRLIRFGWRVDRQPLLNLLPVTDFESHCFSFRQALQPQFFGAVHGVLDFHEQVGHLLRPGLLVALLDELQFAQMLGIA